MRADWSMAAPCSTSLAFLCRTDRRPQHRHSSPSQERARGQERPFLIHIVPEGKGNPPAENSADKYHGVVKFDVATGTQGEIRSRTPPSYTRVFGKA